MEHRSPNWPEGKAPSTLDEFHQCLEASRVLPAEESRRLIASLPGDQRPQTPKALAAALLKAGLLTRFQAQSLLQGKIKYLAFGEYIILDKIGRGGMGQVLKAEHRRMKRTVALKIIAGAAMKSADAVRRFQREVHAAARLIHPNIVTAFDANEHEGVHFFVMEYVAGKDLNALIKDDGPLPIDTAIDYVLQAARGLAYAHSKGIVHRDIKPGNLLVDGDGAVKILDMGLARIDQGVAEAQELTNTGQVMGTVDYMAPEQAEDTHSADARADIYSLGCTFYRLLTGDVLYGGDTVMRKLLAHRSAPIPSLAIARPDVPAAVEAVFRKMVAKRPEERQQSMTQVVTELESCLRGAAGDQTAASAPEPTIDLKLAAFLSGVSKQSGTSVARKKEATAATDVTQTFAAGDTSVGWDKAAQAAGGPVIVAPRSVGRRWLRKLVSPYPLLGVAVIGGFALAAAGIVVFLPVADRTIRNESPPDAAATLRADAKVHAAASSAPGTAAPAESRKLESPGRVAAQTVLSLGGTATIRIADAEQAIQPGGKLPSEEFELLRISITGQPLATDAALAALAEAKSLIDVYLQNVPITDATLQRLATLPKLEILNVPFTPITERGLRHLSGKLTLKALNIDGSATSDDGLASVADMPNLEMLWAAGTQITGAGLVHLQSLAQMKYLNLANTRITDESLAHLRGLVQMRRLVLSDTTLSDAAIAHVHGFHELEELAVANTGVSDAGLAALAAQGPRSIQKLFLQNTRLTDAGLAHLKELPQLRELRLGRTAVTDVGLEHLKSLKNLTDLQLSGAKVTAGGIEELKKALPQCQIVANANGKLRSDKSPSNKRGKAKGDANSAPPPPAIAPLDAAQAK